MSHEYRNVNASPLLFFFLKEQKHRTVPSSGNVLLYYQNINYKL